MIRTRALELQGVRADGAWKVRLGAGIPSASILPMLTTDKPKGSPYANGLIAQNKYNIEWQSTSYAILEKMYNVCIAYEEMKCRFGVNKVSYIYMFMIMYYYIHKTSSKTKHRAKFNEGNVLDD